MSFDNPTPELSAEFIGALVLKALDKSSIDYDYLMTTTRLIFNMLPDETQAKFKNINDILRRYEKNVPEQRIAQRLARIKTEPEASSEYFGKARGQDEILRYHQDIEIKFSENKNQIIKFYASVMKFVQPKAEEELLP